MDVVPAVGAVVIVVTAAVVVATVVVPAGCFCCWGTGHTCWEGCGCY